MSYVVLRTEEVSITMCVVFSADVATMNLAKLLTTGGRKRMRRVPVGLLCTAVVFAIWWNVAQRHMHRRDAAAIVTVNFPPPETFPLLVVTQDQEQLTPHIVYYGQLERFSREHPRYSLYIPPNAADGAES